MARGNKVLIFGGLAVLGFWALNKFRSVQALNVKVRGVNIPARAVTLSIANPGNNFLNLDNITADMVFNGNAVATVNFTQGATIPPGKTAVIQVPVKLNPLDAAGVFWDLLTGKKAGDYFTKGKFTIAGTVKADGVLVPFSETWDFANA